MLRPELQVWLLPPLFAKQMSGLGEGIGIPGPRIPPGACQPIFKVARSLQTRILRQVFN